MHRFLVAWWVVVCLATLGLSAEKPEAPQTQAVPAAATSPDTVERFRADVGFLADDALEGRAIEGPGIEKAAEFLRNRFRKLGLASGTPDGTYFQYFDTTIDSKAVLEASKLVLRSPAGKEIALEPGVDFQPLTFGNAVPFNGGIVFVGFGISAKELDYDDYLHLDVAGKVVIVMRREPQQNDPKSRFNGTEMTEYAAISSKVRNAWSKRAAAVLLVNDPTSTPEYAGDDLMAPNYLGSSGSVGLPIAQIKQSIVDEMLAGTQAKSLAAAEAEINARLNPVSQFLPGWSAKGDFEFIKVDVRTPNIVAVLEGEGPHADETLIVGAHYDHIGYGGSYSMAGISNEIHNGADDNASGTAMVLELARRFAERAEKGEKPSRRLVFILFTAEERGLLGSRHYVKNDPLFPLADTVAMVNFDMVGRLKDNKLTIYGVGTANELIELVDKANASTELDLRKITSASYNSDHASFYGADIPALHLFTGTHRDYHAPTDVADKINYEGMAQVADYSERLIGLLLEQPRRLTFVKTAEGDPHAGLSLEGRTDMAYLGTSPDYGAEVDGVLVSDVRENSPAAKAGLRAGDILTKIGDIPITNAEGLAYALRKHKPGDEVKLTILRGEETLELDATLDRRGR